MFFYVFYSALMWAFDFFNCFYTLQLIPADPLLTENGRQKLIRKLGVLRCLPVQKPVTTLDGFTSKQIF